MWLKSLHLCVPYQATGTRVGAYKLNKPLWSADTSYVPALKVLILTVRPLDLRVTFGAKCKFNTRTSKLQSLSGLQIAFDDIRCQRERSAMQ